MCLEETRTTYLYQTLLPITLVQTLLLSSNTNQHPDIGSAHYQLPVLLLVVTLTSPQLSMESCTFTAVLPELSTALPSTTLTLLTLVRNFHEFSSLFLASKTWTLVNSTLFHHSHSLISRQWPTTLFTFRDRYSFQQATHFRWNRS